MKVVDQLGTVLSKGQQGELREEGYETKRLRQLISTHAHTLARVTVRATTNKSP